METPASDENNRREFHWHQFDASHLLPQGWAEEIMTFAIKNAVSRTLIPTSITSRELSKNIKIPVLTVGGRKIKAGLPWLLNLYQGKFRDLAQSCLNEPLSVAVDDRYAVNLNVQRGTSMRYECHVDSNPLEGLLYVTSHPAGSGGELVVANRSNAWGVEAILSDCKRVYPESGKLIFFDARENPHFVAPLVDPSGVRIVVAMNFYTPTCPESSRPKDLNRHLFGEN